MVNSIIKEDKRKLWRRASIKNRYVLKRSRKEIRERGKKITFKMRRGEKSKRIKNLRLIRSIFTSVLIINETKSNSVLSAFPLKMKNLNRFIVDLNSGNHSVSGK